MKTKIAHWRLKTVLVLAGCFLILFQQGIYAGDPSGGAGKETDSFKLYDDMHCGITAFREGILSITEIKPFTSTQDISVYVKTRPIHFISPAEYTGETRKIGKFKKEKLLEFSSAFNQNIQSFVGLYESEMLFIENGNEYWIPVQEQTLNDFTEYDVKPGGKISLRIVYMWVESFKDGSREYGFFLQAFAEQKEQGLRSISTSEAVFVLFEGEVHAIPASNITDEDHMNSQTFTKWSENHRALKLQPLPGKKFTNVLVKENQLAIIVDGSSTLLYDFKIENQKVVLGRKKILMRVIK
ncbi:hypothetical protein ACFL6W_02285 [Thermodesulfobacteriota bacterium]